VLLAGPRQAGKTTLARALAGKGRRFVTLDDPLTLLAAREDPAGLVRSLDRAAIDEVQRVPELLLALKRSVDADRRPGRFLLTGSANVMALPRAADSLAGRMETVPLLPLARCEIERTRDNWIDRIFAGDMPRARGAGTGEALLDRVLRGGFPEAVARHDPRRRAAWLRQYANALVQRDVREISGIEKLDRLARLLRAAAQAAAQVANLSALGAAVGLDHKTTGKYLAAFEHMYLLRRVEPWSANRLSRIVKAPKLQFIDSGLLAVLAGLTPASAGRDRALFGRVLESFVYSELLKQSTWGADEYGILHYRDRDQVEVDLVIEDAARRIVGVEVKAAASVSASDLKGLRKLAALAADRFAAGVVLYDGEDTVPLGGRLWAAPLATLWSREKGR
jgi:predicted AAA+ superfamily ATPase